MKNVNSFFLTFFFFLQCGFLPVVCLFFEREVGDQCPAMWTETDR